MSIQSPTPAPAGYIDALDRAQKAGAITWDESRKLQARALPQCLPHGNPGMYDGATVVCVECLQERYTRRDEVRL